MFTNINKAAGKINFIIKINNVKLENGSYQIELNQIENIKKTSKGEIIIKLNNNFQISFIIKIINNDKTSQNNKPRNSMGDRINFFSEKKKIEEKQKNPSISKKNNQNNYKKVFGIEPNDKNQKNKIRNSCNIVKPFAEEKNKNINSIKSQQNTIGRELTHKNLEKKISDNIEEKLNKTINEDEIKLNNTMKEDIRSYSLQIPDKQNKQDNDTNKTQSIFRPFGRLSNFIKEKINNMNNKKNNNNNNLNNSQIINKSQKNLKFDKESKINNPLQTQSSKQVNKTLVKSVSSSNLKINNNLKNKLPNLSQKQLDEIKIIDDTQSTSISSNRSSVTEIVLDSIDYENYLEQQKKEKSNRAKNESKNENQKEKEKEREAFCEGFFITSFPKENGSVIENSYSFRAPCGHFKCSKLPSMKPEILMRYPLKDTDTLEINNLAASICFPMGIKVCYYEHNPSIMKDYVTPITNQKGERYYMMTYHFFQRITNSEFAKVYEKNPLKHQLRKFGEAYINLRGEEITVEVNNQIQESLKFCEELTSINFVYIPYCLCLISKYPYIHEMAKCLQSIYYIMINQIDNNFTTDKNKNELNKIIMFLIHSIPIPINRNSKLKFYLPYYKNGIEIACPKLNDINIINNNIILLFDLFSIKNILIIFRLLLFEKKLLFVDDNYERMSNVIDAFTSLIYPFQWIHTYIPIMSEEMINYIETFLPFLNGIHNSLLPLIKKLIKENDCENEIKSNNPEIEEESDDDAFYLIYITENKLGLSSEFKNKFRDVNKYIEDNVPNLPISMEKDFYNKLKKINDEMNLFKNTSKNSINKSKGYNLSKFDLKFRNIFIELFVEMFNNFHKYLCILDNNDVVFNKRLFINEKLIQDRKFYEEFIDTQLFQQFIQTFPDNENYNYFKTMLIHNKKYTKYFSSNYNDKSNDSYYYVIPDSFDVNNRDIKLVEDILKKKCFINDVKINESGILPNTQRILNSINSIDEKKYNNKNCLIYLFPQFKEHYHTFNDKDMEKLNINFLKKYENYKADSDIINENDEYSSNSKTIKLKLNKNNEKITQKEKDDLEEYIKDFSIKLFSSEKLSIYNNKTKTEIQNAISTTYGRKYFINLLLQNIKRSNLVLLQYSYFIFLGNLIYNLILSTLKIEETEELLEQIIYLINSTNYFGKKEYSRTGMNVITLWDIYKPKFQAIPKVYQTNFWKKWYEIEIENREEKSDEDMQDVIYQLCDLMITLELPKSFIKNVLQELSDNIFGKDSEKSKNTFSVFIRKIVNAKYISQVKI